MKESTKEWKRVTKDSYENHAEQFASFTTIYRGKLKKWIDHFSDQFSKGSSILDVGSGAGRDALYLANRDLSVTGIDFSEKLVQIAKEKVPDGKFYVIDFEELSFPEGSFDGIWASASLYHIPKANLPSTLRKINFVLKNNGLFFSLFRVGEGERFTEEKRGDAVLKRFAAYYQPQELEDLLSKAGFKSITSELDLIETGGWVGLFARK